MKNYIRCPYCEHKAFTRFGVILPVFAKMSLGEEYLWAPHWPSGWVKPGKLLDVDNILKHLDEVLGFWCIHCEKPFPSKMTKEIRDYLRKQVILAKFTNKNYADNI